jgi:hypothetical protein
MYDNNPFRLAKKLAESDYQRSYQQDPREFSSEPADDEDMNNLRDRRSEDAITHHHHQYLMHSLAASSPEKSEEERRMHKEEAEKHLKEKLALMAASGIKPQLSNDPKDVPDNEQEPVPFKQFNESQEQEIEHQVKRKVKMESKEFKNLIESIVDARPMSLEEEYQQKLNEAEQEIEHLLDIIEALSEELGIDSNELLNYLDEATEAKFNRARQAHNRRLDKILFGGKEPGGQGTSHAISIRRDQMGRRRIASILSRSGATPEEMIAGVKELDGEGLERNYTRYGSPKVSPEGQRARNLVQDFGLKAKASRLGRR